MGGALVYLYVLLGRDKEARRGFAELAVDGFAGIPLDAEWLYGMSLLAETSVLLGDVEGVNVLYGLHALCGAQCRQRP